MLRKIQIFLPYALLIAVVLFICIAVYISNLVVCRGISCVFSEEEIEKNILLAKDFPDRCAYVGGPTGIGIFRPYKYGRFVRDLLGIEYMFMSTQFLYIWRDGSTDEEIVIVNANRHIILEYYKDDKTCSTNVRLKFDPTKNMIAIKTD
ncbi:hypothetical protein [Methylobacterium sp. Leaf456]|uniref:hypothetical protein n=1 Tax=Methylobacterium sp. Leaf456 TaxID=1736382 RepID=UPI000B07EE60|nr:hypothetical protein [Methylobacterium sp. Leaf456]